MSCLTRWLVGVVCAGWVPLNVQGADVIDDDGNPLLNPTPQRCGVSVDVSPAIHVNDDDDQVVGADGYEKWDWEHNPSSGDDDLYQVTVRATADKSDARVELEVVKGRDHLISLVTMPEFWGEPDQSGLFPATHRWVVPAGYSSMFTVYVEGTVHSERLRDVGIRATLVADSIEVDGRWYDEVFVQSNVAETAVFQVDLDVDSLNDNRMNFSGFDGTVGELEDRSETSDANEEGTNVPKMGKVVVANGGQDSDGDLLPDFADGFTIDGLDIGEPSDVVGIQFVPVRVVLPKPFDPAKAMVEFAYGPVSVPEVSGDGVEVIGSEEESVPDAVVVRAPGLRLWRKDAVDRVSGEEVPEGDFVAPETQVAWQSVDPDLDGTAELFVEYVASPDHSAHGRIKIKVVASEGDGIAVDVVNVTAARLALAVDANHDGAISFPGCDPVVRGFPDLTSSDRPFRFWLNNDQDEMSSAIYWKDTTPETLPVDDPDCDDRFINSVRDLEDFARLHLIVEPFEEMLVSGKLFLGLKWRDIEPGSTPAIRLFNVYETLGGDRYLKDYRYGLSQRSPGFRDGMGGHLGNDLVEPTDGVVDYLFRQDEWSELGKNDHRKYLLFEAVRQGKGSLSLVLVDRDWNVYGEGAPLWLELMDVEHMYQRVHSTPAIASMPYPYDQYEGVFEFPYSRTASGGLTVPDGNVSYAAGFDQQESGRGYEPDYDESDDHIVFVHGINMGIPALKSYTASCYKRLWWAGYRGRLSVFRWTTPINGADIFNDGEFNAWHNGVALARYVDSLKNEVGPEGKVGLIGHSLGNAVVGGAFRAGMTAHSYAMMEAAVPMTCYHEEWNSEPGHDLVSAFYLKVLVDEEAKKATPDSISDLGYRGVLAGIESQLGGTLTNYFNPKDFWLATGELRGGFDVHWIVNQKRYKPNNMWGAMLYDYYPELPESKRGWLVKERFWGFGWFVAGRRPVSDLYESLAYVSRSRSLAMGAEDRITKPPGGYSVNLEAEYGFGHGRPDHSGQFQRDIQLLYADQNGNAYSSSLYERLLVDLGINEPKLEEEQTNE